MNIDFHVKQFMSIKGFWGIMKYFAPLNDESFAIDNLKLIAVKFEEFSRHIATESYDYIAEKLKAIC